MNEQADDQLTHESDVPAVKLVVLDETGSTNDEAHQRARMEAPQGTVVVARRQTGGRGRRGHVWESPEGGLYMSMILRPPVPMKYFMGIPVVVALGLMDAIHGDMSVQNVCLKWPNDVLLAHKKLAGILVEAGTSAEGPYVVCGIGLNLFRPSGEAVSGISLSAPTSAPAPEPWALTAALPESPASSETCCAPLPVAWLSDDAAGASFLQGAPQSARAKSLGYDAISCAAVCISRQILRQSETWSAAVLAGEAQAGPLAPVLDAYRQHVDLLGQMVRVFAPGGTLIQTGMFDRVDAWGRIHILASDGTHQSWTPEQVSLRAFDCMQNA